MDSLIRYGFTIEEIKILMDTNEEISSVSDNHVSDIIRGKTWKADAPLEGVRGGKMRFPV